MGYILKASCVTCALFVLAGSDSASPAVDAVEYPNAEAGGKAKKAKQRRSHNSRKRDKLAMLIALCSDSGGHD